MTASNRLNGDAFGAATAISSDGGTVVAGARRKPFDNVAFVDGPGAAYRYARPVSGWAGAQTETSTLAPFAGKDTNGSNVTPATTNGAFGAGVVMTGDAATVAITGMAIDAASSIAHPVVYVY